MSLDYETKRLIVAIKDNYYDPSAEEKFLSLAPNTSYTQFLDLVYQVCVLLGGTHTHPSQLNATDAIRLLDDPVIAQKAEDIMPRLKAEILEKLASLHGGETQGKEAFDALISNLLENSPEPDPP